jgi:hypothetical protein
VQVISDHYSFALKELEDRGARPWREERLEAREQARSGHHQAG